MGFVMLKAQAGKNVPTVKGIPVVLLEDKKRSKKPDKKLDLEEFLAKCAFIIYSPYDKRDSIPPGWKPRASFNYRRQHLEFLKRFVYPYPLPETLVWASHTWEFNEHKPNRYFQNYHYETIQLAKKWLKDIICDNDIESVFKLYFYAKCRARGMNHNLSIMVSDIFTVKFVFGYSYRLFYRDSVEKLLEGFLDLLARTPVHLLDRSVIGDISDFVLNEVFQYEENTFSFSGRTISSLIKLTNEWHEQLPDGITEDELLMERHRIKEVPTLNTTWKGLDAEQFQMEADQYTWVIRELKTSKELRSEGKKLNSCLASYAFYCKSGKSAIFTVERFSPESQKTESVASLEVKIDSRTLIQAKGSHNTDLSTNVMKVVTNWTSQKKIKIDLTV